MAILPGVTILLLPALLLAQASAEPTPRTKEEAKLSVLGSLAISPDGTRLLATYWDRILLLDLDGSNPAALYAAEENECLAGALFAGNTFAVRNEHNTVRLLDNTGKVLWRSEDAKAIAVSPRESLLAKIGQQGTIVVYNISDPRLPQKQQEFDLPSYDHRSNSEECRYALQLQFLPGGKELMGWKPWLRRGSSREVCFRLDIEKPTECAWYAGGAMSPIQWNYPFLALVHGRSGLTVWDLQENKMVFSQEKTDGPSVYGVWVSGSGKDILVLYVRSAVLLDAEKGGVRRTWQLDSRLSHTFPFAYCSSKSLLALGTVEGRILRFDCKDYTFLSPLIPGRAGKRGRGSLWQER